MDRRVQGTLFGVHEQKGQLATLLELEHNFLGWLIVIIRNPHVVVLVLDGNVSRFLLTTIVLSTSPSPYRTKR